MAPGWLPSSPVTFPELTQPCTVPFSPFVPVIPPTWSFPVTEAVFLSFSKAPRFVPATPPTPVPLPVTSPLLIHPVTVPSFLPTIPPTLFCPLTVTLDVQSFMVPSVVLVPAIPPMLSFPFKLPSTVRFSIVPAFTPNNPKLSADGVLICRSFMIWPSPLKFPLNGCSSVPIGVHTSCALPPRSISSVNLK